MIVYPARDIHPFVMYCVNGKPRSSLLIESTDSMIMWEEMYRQIENVSYDFGSYKIIKPYVHI